MNMFDTIMDFLIKLIFNWTTYAWSIPVWIIIFIVFLKCVISDKVTVGELTAIIIMSLLNPILNWFLVILIVIIPLIMLMSYILEKIKPIMKKKIF